MMRRWQSSGSGSAALTVASLLSLSLCVLLDVYLDLPGSSSMAECSFLILCVSILPSFGVREFALTAMSVLLAFGLLMREDGLTQVLYALDRAAFFAAFIYLVTLLKEAAERSPSVMELGHFLTRQAPGRRYYALAFGGHAMGVVLNFGAISLITPLIQRGVASVAKVEQRAALEQQQLTALIRGFSWMIMWSPTALTQAVLFTSFPGVDLSTVITLGISASLLMILIGRIDDRWCWRKQDLPVAVNEVVDIPRRAATRFSIVCCVLICGAWLTTVMASVSAAVALMLIAPIVMSVWILSQRWRTDRGRVLSGTAIDLKDIVMGSSKVLGRSAFMLGAAGFIGEAAARLAPVDKFANYMEHMNVPDWAFLMSLPVIITLCGQIALSPILVVVFLSSVINQLPVLPANSSLIVFALGAGWALSMSASPNASATLLISGITGIAPTKLTWRWNGRYALLCTAAFFVSFYVLANWFSS